MNKGDVRVKTILLCVIISSSISSLVTFRVMSGDDLLGFIGAIVGVIGAFGLYRYQIKNENKQRDMLNLKFINELLIYTIAETEKIVISIINIYMNFYIGNLKKIKKDDIGLKILKANVDDDYNEKVKYFNIKYKFEEKTFPHLIEKFALEDFLNIGQYKNLFDSYIDKQSVELLYCDFNKIREKIIISFRRLEDIENLVYDSNWTQYIHNTDNKNFENIRLIIKWLNIAPKSIKHSHLMYDNFSIEIRELQEKKEIINSSEKFRKERNININQDKYIEEKFETYKLLNLRMIQKEQLKKDIIYHICDFIYYRDEIIKILREKFSNNEFNTSTEILKKLLDDIEDEIK